MADSPAPRISRRSALQCGLVSVTAGAAAFGFSRRADAAKTYHRLFRIERSVNANIVVYDVVENGEQVDRDAPVLGYWVNKAEGGGTSGLTTLDKMAYGYSVKPEPGAPGSYILTLKAAKDRAIRVLKWNGKWVAQVGIRGKPALLDRIYVAVDSSGILPSAKYVDLYAIDMTTNQPVTERLTK